jgi:8-oxo-dGTP pyrophosphatase MutT (NUDIX family)
MNFATWLLENDSEHASALQTTGFWGKQGAGAIIIAKDTGKILLPHRSLSVQEPNTWGTWGGAIDNDENPKTAAKREVEEEAGYSEYIEMIPLAVFSKNTFKYYNFAALVENEFVPKLNWETQGYKWVNFGDWPSPLHPGLQWLISTDGNKIQNIIDSMTVTQ